MSVTKQREEIMEFIKESKVATICYVKDLLPYCFNCLYAAIPGKAVIVFKSSASSQHCSSMQHGACVAGTIYHASKDGFENIGVQFNGRVSVANSIFEAAEKAYYKCYPKALFISGQLCIITFDTIKFSQTIKGVRRKHSWHIVN